jgi:3-methylcrotonyl-CoA carboxylase alpha subunit
MIVTPLGDGRFRVSDGERERTAWAAGPPSARWVFFDGRVYLVSAAGSQDRGESRAAHDDMALASPMPATVASVNVAPAQTVARGDVLIMLEAMKMELPVRASSAGVITALHCFEGELVQPGIPLVTMESR